MPFAPQPGVYHRMPVFFGPMPGPRQQPPGKPAFDYSQVHVRNMGVRFLTEAAQLESWLPPGFSLWGEPVVTADVTYFNGLPWLAGRGYNMSDVKCQVVYAGKSGPVHGTLVFVRFENLTDPILSGREELGHNKLYCEIPEYRQLDGRNGLTLSWLSSPFMSMHCWDLADDASVMEVDPLSKGMLSYKYIPRTGEWGTPEAAYATLSPRPPGTGPAPIQAKRGQGGVSWVKPVWEDLPTLYHVVGACHDLTQVEQRGSFYVERLGGGSGAATYALD